MSRTSRPTSTPSPRRPRRAARSTAVLGVAVATLACAATASAATVQEPLQPIGTADVVASVGNGQRAWIVRPQEGPAVLWTLRGGVPAQVATLPTTPAPSAVHLDVGTAKDGTPVAAVQLAPAQGAPTLRLVRLDTGASRSISGTRRGLPIGGLGLDGGRLYSTVRPAKTSSRASSTLWHATLTGTSVGRPTKVRDSRRGETWSTVLADRNRVAVETERPVDDGTGVYARAAWAFGTLHGTWRRAGVVLENDGEFSPVAAAGFTQDRSALVTYQGGFPDGPRATRTPIRGGKARTVTAATEADDTLATPGPALDPTTGRLLLRGTDASGAFALGYTAPLFP